MSISNRDWRNGGLCMWAFDLLELDGRDLRELPLTKRKFALETLVNKAGDNRLRFSESFADGVKLLASVERTRLCIVSKRGDAPYRSGPGDWIKVKCASWREQMKCIESVSRTRVGRDTNASALTPGAVSATMQRNYCGSCGITVDVRRLKSRPHRLTIWCPHIGNIFRINKGWRPGRETSRPLRLPARSRS
jgi:bifunctional non-homologous end joining protein LigD